MGARRTGALVVVVGLLAAGCTGGGPNEDDERFLAIAREALAAGADRFDDATLVHAGRDACRVSESDGLAWLNAVGDRVAAELGTDEFAGEVVGVAGATVYCPDMVPAGVLTPEGSATPRS